MKDNTSKVMFTGRELSAIIIPVFIEQLLLILVGIADTLVISYAGEAAVSGVSLINQFNTIFIYLFTALASGGAVIISQYIGAENREKANRSSGQLLTFSILFSLALGLFILLGNRRILSLMFSKVEPAVMDACVTYLRISAYSYPMLAIYNAGASMYRSMGKTSVTMYISVVANLVNIAGNCIGVFLLHAGVAGVAWPSMIARTLSAVWITILCFGRRQECFYERKHILCLDGSILKRILRVALPNGIEMGIFQFVKVALSGIVALFGTYQIAANGVAQSIWSLAALSGVAMGPVFITIIGQCMGKGDSKEAEGYFGKLIKITLLVSAFWNLVTLLGTPLFLKAYVLSPETKKLIISLVILHNIFNTLAFPFAGALGNGLRAAGDVKYTMYVSIFTTVCVRLLLSWIFAMVFQMGVMGVAWAMCMDWTVRGILQYRRLKSGRWKAFRLI